jgi:SAM-dependent methyltransferase
VRVQSKILFMAISVFSALGAMQATQPQTAPTQSVREVMREQAEALQEVTTSKLGQTFLGAAADLPAIADRTIYRDESTRTYYTAAQAEALPEEQRSKLRPLKVTEKLYYFTMYDTPMAYSRPIEILGQHGVNEFSGKRILDIGYGTIGHLHMMASRGAHVVGLDVDSLLTALYSDDQGEVDATGGAAGSIKLINGRLSEDTVQKSAGDQFDLIISKNTLKRGYLHPPPEANVDKRMLIDLGLGDEAFLKQMFDRLKPGGRFLIYNLSPKQADVAAGEKYIPWADGRCPFDRSLIEKAGFRVIEFDRDDSDPARRMGDLLGWDDRDPPMDLQNNLFGHYTLMQKP